MRLFAICTLLCLSYSGYSQSKILVFSKTAGYRHASIPFANDALKKIGADLSVEVDYTESADFFKDESLKKYKAVLFNCTTGNILNNEQQAAFERFIQAGGGYMGIHAAADTEYDWPWYGKLAGAYFESHPINPGIRNANVKVSNKDHVSSSHLPEVWNRNDEWYNYKSISKNIKPLAFLDETSYEGGSNGGNHPIAWYQEYDGGRAFYTGGGHTTESYQEPLFLDHLKGGVKYAIGTGTLDYSKAKSVTLPEEDRFEKTILVNDLNNPMELAVSKDGKVYFTELAGNFSVFHLASQKYKLIHRFPLIMKGGTGLIGLTLDPAFETNKWVYLYYSPPIEGEPIIFNLSRFTLLPNDSLDLSSERIILKVPVQENSGSHHGGSLAFDSDENLILSTGDGTTPFPSDGYAPIDERSDPKYYPMDAQRAASNSNDYKGKILRIHPEKDGSYTIPEGNMFKKTDKTLPEIYAMGCRNPYRIAVNPKTGTVYWGEIGPDAGENKDRGPRGYDEFNQAKKPGFYGWPYFVGNNYAYSEWDFTTAKPGPNYDVNKPLNNSPNNTGLTELPKSVPPIIWYPYAASPDFPELGQGGRSAMAGEFYTFNKTNNNEKKIPQYYDGALFVFDWMRNWMLALRFDENENYIKSEYFMPIKGDFRRPIDLAFGHNGTMYVLEYGSVYGADNKDARLVKIEYNTGNRAPKAVTQIVDTVLVAQKRSQAFLTSEGRDLPIVKTIKGVAPMTIKVSTKVSDLDFEDKSTLSWTLNGKAMQGTKSEITHTFTKNGTYKIMCKASDQSGAVGTDFVIVELGNSTPELKILPSINRSFYWDSTAVDYEVKVADKEDKIIKPAKVKVAYNYYPIPLRPEKLGSMATAVEVGSMGKTLIDNSDCNACHQIDRKSVGPSFKQVAVRYGAENDAVKTLAKKIVAGGGGVWGTTHVMAAHPQVSKQDAEEMVKYIMALNDPNKDFKPLKTKGTLKLNEHLENKSTGFYTLKASYTDLGANGQKPAITEDILRLRYYKLRAMDADAHPGFVFDWGELRSGGHKAHLIYRNLDMTRIKKIGFEYSSENQTGEIEIRKNSYAGPVIGKVRFDETGSWTKRKWIYAEIEEVSGPIDLFFIALQPAQVNGNIIKLNQVAFTK